VRYLSAEDVWRLHLRVAAQAERFGKSFQPGVRDQGLLEAAVNQPRQSFGGADLYPDVFDKGAALMRGIICGHVFMDANKRTGLLAAAMFLEENGWLLDLTEDELEALALDVAGAREQGKEPIGLEEIAERLRKAAKRIG